MATIKLDPQYEETASAVVREFERRGIVLTDYAEGLIRLSVESWYEDTPRIRTAYPLDRTQRDELARRILDAAFEDEHLARYERRRNFPRPRSAQFHDVMYALALSGRKVLIEILDKGF